MRHPVHDLGFVVLEQASADDLMVVNAARVSFGQSSNEMGDRERGLVNFLLKNKHGTPFEHNMFTFHVKLPLFVAREWVRHRIGSFNEVSGRYTTLNDEWYVPALTYIRSQTGKPGAYTFEPVGTALAVEARDALSNQARDAFKTYYDLLERGVAKEVARQCLPVSAYTEWYWTVNARSLMHFLSLRAAPTAQKEIRDYAEVCEDIFALVMPVTYEAFLAAGRISP